VFGSKATGRIGRALAVALAGMALTATPTTARPGELDPGFGHDGKVLGFDGLTSGGYPLNAKMATAPGGSVFVAAGTDTYHAPGSRFEQVLRLRHYLSEGQLDPTFGVGGTLTFHPPAELDVTFEFADLAVDDRGRPLLFGTAFPPAKPEFAQYPSVRNLGPSYAAVVRLLPDGSPDPGFGGGNGVALLDFAAALPPVEGKPRVHVAKGVLDPRGRIVLVVSQTENGTGEGHSYVVRNERLVARLTPTGGLDPTFGEDDGVVPLEGIAEVRDMAFDPEGEIAIGGAPAAKRTTPLLRLDASGRPEPGSGVGGLRRYKAGLDLAQIEIDPFGRILLLGSGWRSSRKTGRLQRVVRLRPGGEVDRSFGVEGRTTVKVPDHSSLTGLAIDRKGRFLLAGTIVLPGPYANWRNRQTAIGVLRLRPSGKLDRVFDHLGRAVTRFGGGASAEATQLVLDGHGRLLVAGLARWPGPTWNESTQVLLAYDLK
jgi:uncharacterized delta-60 repeat protein